jgi:hypothetical protein
MRADATAINHSARKYPYSRDFRLLMLVLSKKKPQSSRYGIVFNALLVCVDAE